MDYGGVSRLLHASQCYWERRAGKSRRRSGLMWNAPRSLGQTGEVKPELEPLEIYTTRSFANPGQRPELFPYDSPSFFMADPLVLRSLL
ncbi:hypothetical protein DPEC_G00261150 [Dallia pectoralis]|uniref:Uncharacterized protein n=1 Tax=Dallia pectoralis TaxID=75939 RepID=A0ACC2FRY4_DALPE|nr:hypothetical protein DPEC_G00261150 [Dallia pectoralis]